MPTPEQLQTFYRVVRQAVLLSSFISFVELVENGNLYVYISQYDTLLVFTIVCIDPDGEATYEQPN